MLQMYIHEQLSLKIYEAKMDRIPPMLICYENACQGTFLVVQWLRLHFPMQRVWVQSLFGEVRSHMPQGQKKKTKQHCKKFNKDLKNGPLKKKKKGRKSGKYLLYSMSTAGTHRVMQNAVQWEQDQSPFPRVITTSQTPFQMQLPHPIHIWQQL